VNKERGTPILRWRGLEKNGNTEQVSNGQRPLGMEEEYIQSQNPQRNVALRRKRRRRRRTKKKKQFNGI